jgi:hypothetical protein
VKSVVKPGMACDAVTGPESGLAWSLALDRIKCAIKWLWKIISLVSLRHFSLGFRLHFSSTLAGFGISTLTLRLRFNSFIQRKHQRQKKRDILNHLAFLFLSHASFVRVHKRKVNTKMFLYKLAHEISVFTSLQFSVKTSFTKKRKRHLQIFYFYSMHYFFTGLKARHFWHSFHIVIDVWKLKAPVRVFHHTPYITLKLFSFLVRCSWFLTLTKGT